MAWHYVGDAAVSGPLLLLSPPRVCTCVHAQTDAEPILHSVRPRSEAGRLAGRPLLAGIQGAVFQRHGRQYRHRPVDRKIHCALAWLCQLSRLLIDYVSAILPRVQAVSRMRSAIAAL